MTITFRIIEPQNLPPEQKSHITFDERGGKMGRSEKLTNDWILLDDLSVSSKHATIEYQDDGYYIVDNKSTNGTKIQRQNQLKPEELQDEKRKLTEGDILSIGMYVIEVSIQKRPDAVTTRTRFSEPGGPESPVTNPTSEAAIHAFLKGAGLEEANLPIDKLDPDFMQTLGQAFRVTVGGIIDLMEARKTFKIAIDAEATIGNWELKNPLKRSQDSTQVLETLLLRQKGFLSMLDSLEEAFEDINAHILAMGEGARVSLDNTLNVFSPDEIEREAKQKWLNADGSKWKTFVKRYKELEIHKLLSDELARAYEDQIDRLKNQHRD